MARVNPQAAFCLPENQARSDVTCATEWTSASAARPLKTSGVGKSVGKSYNQTGGFQRSKAETARSKKRAKSPRLAGLSALVRDGRYWARTSDPQLVELVPPVCARKRFSAKHASEQGFLPALRAPELRRNAAFCAPVVGYMWGGAVARIANGQLLSHLRCICVSARCSPGGVLVSAC
jgi:hypothetical protein